MAKDWDPKFYEAMGRFVATYAEIEEAVYWALIALSGTHRFKALVLINQLSFSNRLKVLYELSRVSTGEAEEREAMKSVVAELERLGALRNQILHSYHSPVGDGREARRQKQALRAKGMRFHDEIYSADDLLGFGDEMWAAHHQLVDCVNMLFDNGRLEDADQFARDAFNEKRPPAV